MINNDLLKRPFGLLLEQYPYARDFFSSLGLPSIPGEQSVNSFMSTLDIDRLEDLGLDPERPTSLFLSFIERMEEMNRRGDAMVRCVSIIGGHDKDGETEHNLLELHSGELLAVVGPTGSGKSMLLSDVECLAQGDTPSGRKILIDQRVPSEEELLSGEHRLVAQLSQNMNFVMDLSVREFLCLHAESRLIEDIEGVVGEIYTTAVGLAGEPFGEDSPVTSLSGGQSRALMIADVACLSASPIVLIDEIENAGVDRRRALNLLIKKEKIVLMATHDPLLALSCNKRVVIQNGGISAIIETSDEEKSLLEELNSMDFRLATLRNKIRYGERLF